MGTRLTSFSVDYQIQELEEKISTALKKKKAEIHREAIDFMYNSENWNVHERLKITKKNDANYIPRPAKEQVYLSSEDEDKLNEMAEYNNCNKGIVFLHALLIYCGYLAKSYDIKY